MSRVKASTAGTVLGSRRHRLVAWSTVAYCMDGHRQHLSAPRFQRLVFETRDLFAQMHETWIGTDWSDLDATTDHWHAAITGNGRWLNDPGPVGCAARAYVRAGWVERIALLDAHLNHLVSPWAWFLRAAMVEYCRAGAMPVPQWQHPRWPLNAPLTNGSGDTVLHVAARYSDWLAEQLLAWGPVLDVVNAAGRTPLHEVARRGFDELTAILLAKGASSNLADAQGGTPLDEALGAYHLECAFALLRAGGSSPLVASRDRWLREQARLPEDATVLAVLDRIAIGGILPAATPAAPARSRL